MISIKETEPKKLVDELAKEMASGKMTEMPGWAIFVKTGVSRERPPEDPGWWYQRSASIFRRICLDGPVGTERLRTYYGGRKSCGVAPHRSKKAGGKIIRSILQQLENAGMIKKAETGRKGRVMTAKGQKFMNSIIKNMVKGQ
jgi:small subunit ribosomal protein S19e